MTRTLRHSCGPLALGFVLGAVGVSLISQGVPQAGAEVRPTPQREAFKAGGERSEVTLREILEVLKQMDKRLERMESAVGKKK
jgi:hypothetical protein